MLNIWRAHFGPGYLRKIAGFDPFGQLIWLPRTMETFHPQGPGGPMRYDQGQVDHFNENQAFEVIVGSRGKKTKTIRVWGLDVPRADFERIVMGDG